MKPYQQPVSAVGALSQAKSSFVIGFRSVMLHGQPSTVWNPQGLSITRSSFLDLCMCSSQDVEERV